MCICANVLTVHGILLLGTVIRLLDTEARYLLCGEDPGHSVSVLGGHGSVCYTSN
jgi:hypothetical protein